MDPVLYQQVKNYKKSEAVDLYKTDILSLGVTFIECLININVNKINKTKFKFNDCYEKLHKTDLPIQIK